MAKMNNRIKELREKSLAAPNTISAERAQLVTDFYKNNRQEDYSVPVFRAMCFSHIFNNKALYVGDTELIVGERGPKPKATPTYPEISLHSVQDLEILHNREKVSFSSNDAVRKVYQHEIIPFWTGKSNREAIMNKVSDSWLNAYQAGVFTEFQEQRAPGHTVLGKKMFSLGFKDIIAQVKAEIGKRIAIHTVAAKSELEELRAMQICAEAIISYSKRYAKNITELADKEINPSRKQELHAIAAVCARVPEQAPTTFHEALQHYWFIHLGVITELNPWDSFNPGRLDQHLYPFYKKELDAGTLSKEQAVELLQAFWIKFNNHPAPPKVGVTALESNTYTDFALINLGGLKPDGTNAVNELSYILLDVIEEMRLLQPSSMVQVSKQNPDSFLKRAIKITKTGFGQPSIFNTDAIIQELLRQGKSIEDARNGGASGCVETGAFGTESYVLTGYFNLVKILEITLNNGFDKRTNKQIGLHTGEPESFLTFEDLKLAFKRQVNHFADIKIEGNLIIEEQFAKHLPAPFLSTLVDDCITTAKDYNNGGARYNTSYIQGVGLGSITDMLTSIKYNIFDNKIFSWDTLKQALNADFNGYEELQKNLIYHTPTYGNDDDYADKQAVDVFELFYDAVDGRPCYRGGVFRINMLPTTSHVYFGSVTGATADGRRAGEPLSEGISPFQGADRNGPTSVIKSASKFDHIRTGGTLLNQKFSPSFFQSDAAIDKVKSLVRSYFRLDGHHIQFNVVDAETLRDAQVHPEKHQDLIVRVAGYSDYFNDLGEDLQNEIIRRTAHSEF